LIALGSKVKRQLANREANWRLKSWAIWLENGDENMTFFQQYADHRKKQNTIWEMKDEQGEWKRGHGEITRLEVRHFQKIYREPERVNIAVIVKN
jgi:hypothetical protein